MLFCQCIVDALAQENVFGPLLRMIMIRFLCSCEEIARRNRRRPSFAAANRTEQPHHIQTLFCITSTLHRTSHEPAGALFRCSFSLVRKPSLLSSSSSSSLLPPSHLLRSPYGAQQGLAAQSKDAANQARPGRPKACLSALVQASRRWVRHKRRQKRRAEHGPSFLRPFPS